MRVCTAWLLVAAVAVVAGRAGAAEPAKAVDTQVARIALFKNGLGFFIRQGALPDQPGPVRIGPLPAASHGTLWLTWGPGATLAHLAAGEEKTLEWRDAVSIPDLLRANLGKQVRLEFGSEYRSSLEGTLKTFPQPSTPAPPNPYMAGSYIPPRSQGQVVTLQTAAGVVAIKPSTVDRITFLEDPSTQYAQDIMKVALSGDLTATGPGQTVGVSYLAKGMTWAPSFIVDISTPEEGTITAKAEIINEMEDLEKAHVDLVTGFPFLEFSDIISPLAKKGDLATFLRALGQGYSEGREQFRRETMTQQVMYNAYDAMEAAGPSPDYGAGAAGVQAEDLFLYPLDSVTLKKDQVGYYPLFTQKVAYEHVYEWDIPDYVNAQDQYRRAEQNRPAEVVWHSLRLKNAGQVPWTTGPAETMKDGQILGQAMLTYTSPGNNVMLKITKALGIKAQENELETNREVNALQRHGWSYDRITVEGKLALHNYTAQAMTVKITKTLSGEVVTSAPEAKTVKLAKGLRQENPRSELTWEVPLEVGKAVEVAYTYKVLIRR